MKKISLLLAVLMIMASFCLVSCDNGSKTPSATTPASTATAATAKPATSTAKPTNATAEPTNATAEPATATAEPTGTVKPLHEAAILTGVDTAAYAAMQASLAKIGLEDSYKIESSVSVITSAGGMTIDVKTNDAICIINALTPDKTTGNKISETSMLGMNGKEEVYYENGYAYYTASQEEGGNYKTPADISVILGTSVEDNLDSIGFKESGIEASKLISNADGSSKVLLRINKDVMLEGSEEGSFTGTLSDGSYFYVTFITDSEGRPSNITIETKMVVTENGESNSSTATMQMTYSYDNVVVTAPEGYEAYEE